MEPLLSTRPKSILSMKVRSQSPSPNILVKHKKNLDVLIKEQRNPHKQQRGW